MLFFAFYSFSDAANKKRFDSMQSMVEAKYALNYLFEVAANGQVNTAAREADLKDLQVNYIDWKLLKKATFLKSDFKYAFFKTFTLLMSCFLFRASMKR